MKLAEFEMSWAKAALGAMFPRVGMVRAGGAASGTWGGVADLDVDGFLAATFAGVPLEPALGLRLSVWIVAFAPLFAIGRWCTIRALPEDERERVVQKLLASPFYAVRQLVLGLKAIGAMLYVTAPAVRERMLAKGGALVALRVAGREVKGSTHVGSRPAA
jgi:hypothetical protein